MNIDMIRTLYDYHFAVNRRLWDECVSPLTGEQFNQENDYSAGSVKGQIVHIMRWDEQWFHRLREIEPPPRLVPGQFPDRAAIRAYWDQLEKMMRECLEELDETRFNGTVHTSSVNWGEIDIPVWQILVHVANHATDHRAQLLRLLDQIGAPTFEQDLMLYLWQQNSKR
jgi:uncharacterized damage-inducible protein DinB